MSPVWESLVPLPLPHAEPSEAWVRHDAGRPSGDPFLDLETARLFGTDRKMALEEIERRHGRDISDAWRISVGRNDPGADVKDRPYFVGETDGWSRLARARFAAHFARYAEAVVEIDDALAATDDPRFAALLLVDRARHVRDGESAELAMREMAKAILYARRVGAKAAFARGLLTAAEFRVWRASPHRPRIMASAIALLRRCIRESTDSGASGTRHLALMAVDALAEKTGNRAAIEEAVLAERIPAEVLLRSRRDGQARLAREVARDRIRLRGALDEAAQAILVFDPMVVRNSPVDFACVVTNLAANALTDHPTLVSVEALRGPALERLRPLLELAYERGEAKDTVEGERSFARRAIRHGREIILTVGEITEYRAAEAAARKSERVMREFLADTSHEVRSPLNGILGLARMLAEQPLDAMSATYVRSILASGETLLKVLNDVLDFSKLEAGRFELLAVPTDPRALVHETADLFRGLAVLKGVEIVADADLDVPSYVTVDGARLRQILFNLVGNAVKFSGPSEVALRARYIDGKLRVDVGDRAGGVPPEEIEAIFRPYGQGEQGRVSGGTGLGLPLSRRLAEAMGGELVYVPITGGSIFRVEIPAPASAPSRQGKTEGVRLGLRVLVAEDEPINGLVVRSLLERLGCRASVVTTGAEAIEAVASHAFDVVLMDVRMPDIDGLEATRQLRAIGVMIPIVALTAGVMESEKAACLAAGMNAFLSKPIREDELVKTLTNTSRDRDADLSDPVT